MNLQAVLTILVTGRVSHVRVVASEMPDQEVAHPSIPGRLPVGEPIWQPPRLPYGIWSTQAKVEMHRAKSWMVPG